MNNIVMSSQEQGFLRSPKVKEQLNKVAIVKLEDLLNKEAEKTLDRTLLQAKNVSEVVTWWKESGKQIAKDMGVLWTNEAFYNKALGLSKSRVSELCQLALIPTVITEEFKAKVLKAREHGQHIVMDYKTLNSYYKKTLNPSDCDAPIEVESKPKPTKESKPKPLSKVEEAYIDSLTVTPDRPLFGKIDVQGVQMVIDEQGNFEGKYTRANIDFLISLLEQAKEQCPA